MPWINELEKRYGEDVLEEMVDKEVVKQAAEKYKVKITDEELDRELKMMKTMYGTAGQTLNKSSDQLRQEIQSSLLLEKLLTKDVSVSKQQCGIIMIIIRISTGSLLLFIFPILPRLQKNNQTKSYVNWRKASLLMS